jgi:SAM-dependent methyltransferase
MSYSVKARYHIDRILRSISLLWETLLSAGGHSERILIKLLLRVYKSQFLLQWKYSERKPHFEDQRIDISYFAFGEDTVGPYSFYRGFLSSEILHEGDRLLDIGCGDGFFTRRFFAEKCGHIDAIDLDQGAIDVAKLENCAANIKYHVLDAVQEPFPLKAYDVVVWDGALAHFPRESTERMLQKIRQSLSDDGVFVGSESIGVEGGDHLQEFLSLEEMGALFKPHFRFVELRSMKFRNIHGNTMREEGYWRCSNDNKRLLESRWRPYQ